jgi:alanine dehydrogenase
MELNPLDTEQLSIKTLEKRLMKSQSQVSLKIGIPREISKDERRISLTPAGISVLKANGHEIYIEKNAGIDAHFTDNDFSEAGATIVYSPQEVFKQSDIIVKVAPPTAEEQEWLQSGQVLLSALHLGNTSEEFLKTLIAKGVTALGYEFIHQDGEFPLVRMMHEITGSMAVQIAAHYLENNSNGQGIMLGGISGIPPATVVILGAGIIGEYAARTALGYGAQVFVMDNDLAQLRRLENSLDRRIITATATHQYLSSALEVADVVIGAAMTEGERAPCWVTEPMVASMKNGSVIVDTVIDQGGCVATSKATSHSNPVFRKDGVVHYCVPNIPSNVARTATYALNNVIVPYLISIGDAGGIREVVWTNTALRNGIYIYRKNLTKQSLAKQFNMPYREIDMLIASQL